MGPDHIGPAIYTPFSACTQDQPAMRHTCRGELHSGHLLATGGPVRALKCRLTLPLFAWTFSTIFPSGCSWNA